jgi:hypothetical protein
VPVTGIFGHTLAVIIVVVGLLSGSLSVLRELQVMYAPTKASERQVFWSWVRIAFVVAAVLLWWDERSKVRQLTSQLAAQPGQPVQINVPPAVINSPPETAYIAARDPMVVLGTYKVGGNWAVSEECKNTSTSVVARAVACVQGLRIARTEPNVFKQPIVTQSVQEDLYLQFQKDIASAKPAKKNYGPGESTVGTVFSPIVNDKLDIAFRRGSRTLLFLGEYTWKDAAGQHDNEICAWLQLAPQMFAGPGALAPNVQFVWQYCAKHNGLKE